MTDISLTWAEAGSIVVVLSPAIAFIVERTSNNLFELMVVVYLALIASSVMRIDEHVEMGLADD